MIYEGTNFTIEGTFSPSSVCYAEKNAIRLRTLAGTETNKVTFKLTGLGTYHTYGKNGAREIEIDLTDWFRVQNENGATSGTLTIVYYLNYVAVESFDMAFAIVAPYDMAHIVRPGSWHMEAYEDQPGRSFAFDRYGVLPPLRILTNPSMNMSTFVASTFQVSYYDAEGAVHQEKNADGAYIIAYNPAAVAVYGYSGNSERMIVEQDDCRPLRLFRWMFPNGMTVQHWLRVYNVTDSVGNKQELMSQFDAYDVQKGLLQTLEVGLDSLVAYDTWYYGTMIMSSRVEMYRTDTKTWERVNVTTTKNEVTATTDGKFKQLRMDVALIKHDAI